MKHITRMIPALLCSLLLPDTASAQQQSHARAEAHASAEGSHVERKTVTVVTENGRTVRKTTIFRNGKEETKTEILDGEGNLVEGGNEPGDEAAADDRDENAKESRPWIGLRVEAAPESLRSQLGLTEDDGAVINAVAPGGPAEDAGLEVNDLLLKFDGQPVGSPDDLRRALDSCVVGQQVKLDHLRRGKEQQAKVTLEEEPSAEQGSDRTQKAERPDGKDAKAGDSKRNGSVQVEVSGDSIDSLDAVLDDPNVPEDFKKSVREMQERMRDFERRHKPR
jgi:C-terminal processing protease CtpA/Prc